MSATEFRESILIPPSHPALAGHFPGNPVVPGLVLLDHVAAALERWRGQRVAGLPHVKFLRPLAPGEAADLVLSDDGKSIRFSIVHNGATLASGVIEAA
jgi:3-hydroxymyristoyl/3-hydroxydecanoyl-(acyl carrier protein) dehydratase